MPAPAPCTPRPATAQEDFAIGRRYGLPVDNPVGRDGRFRADAAAVRRRAHLRRRTRTSSKCCAKRGALLHHERFGHSYPHCWRHKTPVIFRATPQWFISMDQAGLRRDSAQPRDRQRAVDARLGRAAHPPR